MDVVVSLAERWRWRRVRSYCTTVLRACVCL